MRIMKLRTRRPVLHPQLTELLMLDPARMEMEPSWFGVTVKRAGLHPVVVPWSNVLEVEVDSAEEFMTWLAHVPRVLMPRPLEADVVSEPRPDADCYRAAFDASIGPLAKLEVAREGYETGVLSRAEAAEMLLLGREDPIAAPRIPIVVGANGSTVTLQSADKPTRKPRGKK